MERTESKLNRRLPKSSYTEEDRDQDFQTFSEHTNLNALCISDQNLSNALKSCIGKPKCVKITESNIPIAKTWLFGSNSDLMVEKIKLLLDTAMKNDPLVKDLLTVIVDRDSLCFFISKKIVHEIELELKSVSWSNWLFREGYQCYL